MSDTNRIPNGEFLSLGKVGSKTSTKILKTAGTLIDISKCSKDQQTLALLSVTQACIM